jgi:hypothetical protein
MGDNIIRVIPQSISGGVAVVFYWRASTDS